MFRINKSETREWIVTCFDPNGRTHAQETFVGVFHWLDQPRVDEINKQCRQRQVAELTGESTEGMIDDIKIAREVLAGWKEINDAQTGDPYEFTEARKEAAIKQALFAGWVVNAWNEMIQGGRKKTSKTQPGFG
jgi:hypothetical protein